MTRRRVLTDQQVRDIRAQHKPGVRGAGYEWLARRYGATFSYKVCDQKNLFFIEEKPCFLALETRDFHALVDNNFQPYS